MPSATICALTFALCISYGVQQGYMGSLLNVEYIFIVDFMNETIHERMGVHPSPQALNLIFSSFNIILPIASIAGQFLAAWSCRRFGRKGTALLSCIVLYLPGTLLSTIAEPARSFELLFIGRILWCVALSNDRVAPLHTHPLATGLPSQCLSLDIRCAHLRTRPRESRSSIARSLLWRHYRSLDDELSRCEKKTASKADENNEKHGVSWMFNPCFLVDDKMRVVRQAAWLGVAIAYIFTSTRTLRSYSTFVLHYLTHFTLTSAIYGSWVISILRIPSTLVPVLFVDRIGRRPLIIFSLVITVLSLSATRCSLAGLVRRSGAGERRWTRFRFYAAELVPRSLLLEAMSILSGIEAFTKIFVDFASYQVANVIDEFHFNRVQSLLMFAVPSLLFLLAIWKLCPETSGRSVHQVLDDIAGRKNIKVSFTS